MISIITLCPLSYGQWLGQCCESVRAQTNQDLEHIVITIGFDTFLPSVRMIRLSDDPGLSTCRNIGVAAAKGEYIMMLDSDDWLAQDYVEKVTPHLGSGKVVCSTLWPFENGDGLWEPPTNVTFDSLREANSLYYNCAFHREDFPGYDPALNEFGFEDWALWVDMADRCCEFVSAPEAVLNYRVHINSHTHRSWKHHEARMAYLRKKHGVR